MQRIKLPEKVPFITITFKEPIYGFWNGGKKVGGTFTPTLDYDGVIKWGCFELNIWFRVAFGKSWNDAVTRARAKIRRACRVPCITGVVWG